MRYKILFNDLLFNSELVDVAGEDIHSISMHGNKYLIQNNDGLVFMAESFKVFYLI